MDDIETTDMLLTVNDDARPSHVASASDYNNISSIELDEIRDLVLRNIELNGVVGPNPRVGITNSSTVVGNNVWDTLRTEGNFSDLKKLVAGFLRCDTVDGETTLDIVKKAEVLARFFNGDDIWGIDTFISFSNERF